MKARADLYAQATGYRVARLVSLSENGGVAPTPQLQGVAMAASRVGKLPPVSGGMLEVRVDLYAVYELAR